MTIDISKLESLLEEKDLAGAGALISQAVSSDLTEEEEGGMLTGLASVYLEVSNSMNERYLSALNETIASLEALQKAEGLSTEKIELATVREQLNEQ